MPNPATAGKPVQLTYLLNARPQALRARCYTKSMLLVREWPLPAAPGRHAVPLDMADSQGRPLPSGVYFLQLKDATGVVQAVAKLMLLE